MSAEAARLEAEALATFEAHRDHLRGVAYRMTGSLAEADDLLQEAYLRFRHIDAKSIDNHRGYLVRVVTRLCLDASGSARVRRERYVGTWLPEPVLDTESFSGPAGGELAHDLTVALMLALERLSPIERAAFLLHDVFDVGYLELADTLGRSEVSCRKLCSRARERVREHRPRKRPDEAESARVLEAFAAALGTGDLSKLESVLSEDATLYSDGGGKVPAATLPIFGRDRILRFVGGLLTKFRHVRELKLHPTRVNGQSGAVLSHEGVVVQTVCFELSESGLQSIYIVLNPDKVRHVAVDSRAVAPT